MTGLPCTRQYATSSWTARDGLTHRLHSLGDQTRAIVQADSARSERPAITAMSAVIANHASILTSRRPQVGPRTSSQSARHPRACRRSGRDSPRCNPSGWWMLAEPGYTPVVEPAPRQSRCTAQAEDERNEGHRWLLQSVLCNRGASPLETRGHTGLTKRDTEVDLLLEFRIGYARNVHRRPVRGGRVDGDARSGRVGQTRSLISSTSSERRGGRQRQDSG
jgi:hypothetical protein